MMALHLKQSRSLLLPHHPRCALLLPVQHSFLSERLREINGFYCHHRFGSIQESLTELYNRFLIF